MKEQLLKQVESMKKQGDAPLFIGGFLEGAHWENKRNKSEVAALRLALSESIDIIETLISKMQQTHNIPDGLNELVSNLRKHCNGQGTAQNG